MQVAKERYNGIFLSLLFFSFAIPPNKAIQPLKSKELSKAMQGCKEWNKDIYTKQHAKI